MRKIPYPIAYSLSYYKMFLSNGLKEKDQVIRCVKAMCQTPCYECPFRINYPPASSECSLAGIFRFINIVKKATLDNIMNLV